MTNLLAVYFLIGTGCLLLVLLFIFKNKMIAMLAGLDWAALALYNMGYFYTSGDPDVGTMTWAFGWICVIATIICWTSPLWLMKTQEVKKEAVVVKDRMTQINERVAQVKKFRPKKRDPFWNE
jgi:hypothetical protein